MYGTAVPTRKYLLIVPPGDGLILLRQAVGHFHLLLHRPLQHRAGQAGSRAGTPRHQAHVISAAAAPPMARRPPQQPATERSRQPGWPAPQPHPPPLAPSTTPPTTLAILCSHLKHKLLLSQLIDVLLQGLELLSPAGRAAPEQQQHGATASPRPAKQPAQQQQRGRAMPCVSVHTHEGRQPAGAALCSVAVEGAGAGGWQAGGAGGRERGGGGLPGLASAKLAGAGAGWQAAAAAQEQGGGVGGMGGGVAALARQQRRGAAAAAGRRAAGAGSCLCSSSCCRCYCCWRRDAIGGRGCACCCLGRFPRAAAWRGGHAVGRYRRPLPRASSCMLPVAAAAEAGAVPGCCTELRCLCLAAAAPAFLLLLLLGHGCHRCRCCCRLLLLFAGGGVGISQHGITRRPAAGGCRRRCRCSRCHQRRLLDWRRGEPAGPAAAQAAAAAASSGAKERAKQTTSAAAATKCASCRRCWLAGGAGVPCRVLLRLRCRGSVRRQCSCWCLCWRLCCCWRGPSVGGWRRRAATWRLPAVSRHGRRQPRLVASHTKAAVAAAGMLPTCGLSGLSGRPAASGRDGCR